MSNWNQKTYISRYLKISLPSSTGKIVYYLFPNRSYLQYLRRVRVPYSENGNIVP